MGQEQELVDSDLSSSSVSTPLGCLVQSRRALEGPLPSVPFSQTVATEAFCIHTLQPLFFIILEGPPFPSLAGESHFQLKYLLFFVNYSLTPHHLLHPPPPPRHLLPPHPLFHLSYRIDHK